MDERFVTVPQEAAGQRLDKWLAGALEGITRQQVQRLVKEGCVCRESGIENRESIQSLQEGEGTSCTDCSMKVKSGERYHVRIPEPDISDVLPEDIPLDFVFEDEHLLVINKPAEMVVHPAAGVSSGTLVNALLHHCGESLSGIGGVARPGIVHRLDKDTSGLMLVAKHDVAHQGLSEQLQDRSLSRTYHAWCWGAMQPPAGSIDAPIGRSSRDRKKMAIVEGGKPAVTHYTTLRRYGMAASLVECRLETGRTHQIRVHLSEAGCGLIGDPVYGMPTARRLVRCTPALSDNAQAVIQGLHRQALHAVAIRFIHPVSGEELAFEVGYPEELEELEKELVASFDRNVIPDKP